jgi:class 3 adenylate cyclase
MFGSVAGALRCALAIRDVTRGLAIELRIGVHTGEVEILPNDIAGIAVHTAARIMALGGPSEIIVSAAARALVGETDLHFEELGQGKVKGLDVPIEVLALRG